MSGLDELKLRVISRSGLHIDRRYLDDDEPPSWWSELEGEHLSGAVFKPWMSGSVLAQVRTRVFHKEIIYVAVTVDAIYATDEQLEQRSAPPKDLSDWAMHVATDDERRTFAQRVVRDTFPTLRAEVLAATTLAGIPGVLLDETHVKLGGKAEWQPDDAEA